MGQSVFPLPPATTDLTKMTYNTYNYTNTGAVSVPAVASAGTRPYGSADLFTINGAGVLTELRILQIYSSTGIGFTLVVDGVEKELFIPPAVGSTGFNALYQAGYYTYATSTSSYNSIIVRDNLSIKFNSSITIRVKNAGTSPLSIIGTDMYIQAGYYT